MPRAKSRILTDAELRIMEVLWAKGAATVAEVAQALAGEDGTVQGLILTAAVGLGFKLTPACFGFAVP